MEIVHLTPRCDKRDLFHLTKMFLESVREIDDSVGDFLDEYYANVVAAHTHSPEKYTAPEGLSTIYTVKGVPVGTVSLQKFNDSTCEIKRLFVLPQYRGQGIATQLLKEIIDQATCMGYHRIRLDSAKQHTSAHKIYENLGFIYTDAYQPMHPLLEGKMVFMCLGLLK